MGEATGLGIVDLAVLEAVESLTGAGVRRRVKTRRVLEVVEDRLGLPSDDAYRVVQRLVQPWHSWLSPLDGNGNFGSEAPDPAADAKYTEIGLSALGVAALAAERGTAGPLPIALCNGTLAHGGRRPPFKPSDVTTCLRALLQDPALSDRGLRTFLPIPTSPNGCHLDVDAAALWAGRRTGLVQRVRTHVEDGDLVITAVPLGIGTDSVLHSARRSMREVLHRRVGDRTVPWPTPVAGVGHHDHRDLRPEVRDETSRSGIRLVVLPGGERDLVWVQDELLRRWPLMVQHDVQLPMRMNDIMRTWAVRCADGHQLDVLERESRP